MIHLIGPGGAGKTTTGQVLAHRLGVPFMDLDAVFIARHGDVAAFIETSGYQAYAARNVETYRDVVQGADTRGVIALSSGFMIYPGHVHPDYIAMRELVVRDPLTFLLLPALELEACVAEIVRRQLQRAFARTPEREEQVIRARFSVHVSLPVRKIITQFPVCRVVDQIMGLLGESHAHLFPAVPARSFPPSPHPRDA